MKLELALGPTLAGKMLQLADQNLMTPPKQDRA